VPLCTPCNSSNFHWYLLFSL